MFNLYLLLDFLVNENIGNLIDAQAFDIFYQRQMYRNLIFRIKNWMLRELWIERNILLI